MFKIRTGLIVAAAAIGFAASGLAASAQERLPPPGRWPGGACEPLEFEAMRRKSSDRLRADLLGEPRPGSRL